MTPPIDHTAAWQAMSKKERAAYVLGMKKAVELFTAHEEGFGQYCDTGADMEWSCRSECVEHGVGRCRKYYKQLTA